jgi:hypothetical protein
VLGCEGPVVKGLALHNPPQLACLQHGGGERLSAELELRLPVSVWVHGFSEQH